MNINVNNKNIVESGLLSIKVTLDTHIFCFYYLKLIQTLLTSSILFEGLRLNWVYFHVGDAIKEST